MENIKLLKFCGINCISVPREDFTKLEWDDGSWKQIDPIFESTILNLYSLEGVNFNGSFNLRLTDKKGSITLLHAPKIYGKLPVEIIAYQLVVKNLTSIITFELPLNIIDDFQIWVKLKNEQLFEIEDKLKTLEDGKTKIVASITLKKGESVGSIYIV